ncbi:U-reduvitoxin-Pr21 [Halyomorpha halys]|uniref:U-reduvitoxin-Pr21 n=1 Tax=Halyomorpha halys TaxID=286706 RepID=UPI0034D2B359
MKVLVVVTLLLSIISLITGGAATRKTSCSPGESWKDSCHTCICDNDGRPLCTRELCKGQGIKMVLPPIRDKREAKECEPGTTWKEDCNTCFCTPNGHIGCTRRECFHPTRKYKNRDLLIRPNFKGQPPQRKGRNGGCSPGEKWKESCNTCICNNDGSPVCTRELCKDQGVEMVLPVIREKREATECEPGTSWKEDCNTCVCTSNGQITCTRMKCFRVPPRNRYSTS